MNTVSKAPKALSGQSKTAMERMGHNLEIAIKRRGMTRKEVSERAFISEPTLRNLLRGDPTVGIGCLGSVLQVLGLDSDLEKLASPAFDEVGMALAERNLPKIIRKKRGKYEF
jgi:transcriptional regulator with XRE-family HTH domain